MRRSRGSPRKVSGFAKARRARSGAARNARVRARTGHAAQPRRKSARSARAYARDIASHALASGNRPGAPSDIELVQHPVPRSPKSARPATKANKRRRNSRPARPRQMPAPPRAPGSGAAGSPGLGLGQLLSPKNLQGSLKTVGNLHGMVRNWLNYLQQADQILETFVVTGNSLKETGVLDKLVKHRGKNLTTDDFTNILIALMNSPVGHRFFKSVQGSQDGNGTAPPSADSVDTGAPPALPPPGGTDV
jgi:hypothetical protein